MPEDDLISQLNDGRTANVLLEWMGPIFEEVEKSTVNSLKSNFRNGSYTELVLACHVAQLCAIEDLKTRIKGIAARGDYAAKRLHQEEGEDLA